MTLKFPVSNGKRHATGCGFSMIITCSGLQVVHPDTLEALSFKNIIQSLGVEDLFKIGVSDSKRILDIEISS